MYLKTLLRTCILIFIATSCSNAVKVNFPEQQKSTDNGDKDNVSIFTHQTTCDVADIFSLNLKQNQIDSIFDKIENDLANDFIFGSVTKMFLIDFFNSIDKEVFIQNLEYSKEYEFNRYPSEYKSNTACVDEILLRFFKDECTYRLTITNSFYVEDFGCSEHGTIYIFKIIDNQINLIDFVQEG